MITKEKNLRQCPGCKVLLPSRDDLAGYQKSLGRYGVTSPECEALFDEVLARFFDQFSTNPGLILPIDAYAVQHPPHFEHQAALNISKRFIDASIQSVGIHLVILYLMVEKKMPKSEAGKIANLVLVNGPATLPYLEPPLDLGTIKITNVAKANTADELETLIWEWARSAWNAWSAHHETIRSWYMMYGHKLQK